MFHCHLSHSYYRIISQRHKKVNYQSLLLKSSRLKIDDNILAFYAFCQPSPIGLPTPSYPVHWWATWDKSTVVTLFHSRFVYLYIWHDTVVLFVQSYVQWCNKIRHNYYYHNSLSVCLILFMSYSYLFTYSMALHSSRKFQKIRTKSWLCIFTLASFQYYILTLLVIE